ncbi:hypothetical protein BJY16_005305 [Actinoplanes octamycinicus]|uniref:Uncharacterized protein n=1 Tax=Actinoplanes octamycinicus TaxID=135948 RepID=A0A7W7H0Q1_9ACTN|nr:hypothetical protein [Actinoplanes octamycinicus]MBB4741846.1 hypothetical protein [Actinoplanes octamycinicus]GIE60610.1 hypothetical protein Aoc01nite_60120 [Actinoplanes octamycinicus]
MLIHPDMMLTLANERRNQLIAEADQERLLTAAGLRRLARKARTSSAVRGHPTVRPA